MNPTKLIDTTIALTVEQQFPTSLWHPLTCLHHLYMRRETNLVILKSLGEAIESPLSSPHPIKML